MPVHALYDFEATYFYHCLTNGDSLSVFYDSATLFNTDAMFRDTAVGDYRLLPCSPARDAGDNAAAAGLAGDFAGAPRIQGAAVDMGAFESPAFGPAQSAVVRPACSGVSNGSIALFPANGCEPLQYHWQPPAALGPDATGLPPGQYAVTVEDARGRSFSDTLLVAETPSPDIQVAAADITCGSTLGGSVAVDVVSGGTPPFQFNWNTGATDPDLSALGPGWYAVTVTDAWGCADSAVALISLNGQLTLIVDGEPISCFGAADGMLNVAPLSGKSPFDFQWSHGPQDAQVDQLGPGQYAVTVTDYFGCTASYAFKLSDPLELQLFLHSSNTNNLQTPNGTATAVAGGGTPAYAYAWSTGASGAQLTGLGPGIYTVTVTDEHGCTATAQTEVMYMVGTAEAQSTVVTVWPNPTREAIYLQWDGALPEGARWLLYDALGKKVAETEAVGNPAVLQVAGLPRGGYQWALVVGKGDIVRGRVLLQ